MMTAQAARFSVRGVCFCGDTVLIKNGGGGEARAAEVKLLASCLDVPFAVLNVWEHVSTDRRLFASLYLMQKHHLQLCQLHDILAVCTYKRYPDNRALVLLPYGLRDC